MTGRSLWILGLVGALVLTVMSMAAEAGSSRSSRTQYDRTVSGLTEQHLRTKRTHHRGRSFLERRAVTRRDPLPGHRASEPPRLSNSDLSRAYPWPPAAGRSAAWRWRTAAGPSSATTSATTGSAAPTSRPAAGM
jgi:hypothetical protein